MLNRTDRGVTVGSIAPERTTYDQEARPCLCGERPLMTESGGTYYLSCPPCWTRMPKVGSERLARAMWNAMIRVATPLGH